MIQHAIATKAPSDGALSPIDEALARLCVGMGDGGFSVRLERSMKDGERALEYTVRRAVGDADEWIPPARRPAHVFLDAESLVLYTKKYSSAEKGLVCISDTEIRLVLDEGIERGVRSGGTAKFRFSRAWEAWMSVMEKPIDHKTFGRLVLNHSETVVDQSVIKAVRSVSLTATVKRDSDLRDDGDTMTVVFSTSGGDSMARFPKRFAISCPVLVDDDAAEFAEFIEQFDVRVEILFPSKPDDPLKFMLSSHEMDRVKRRRLARVAENVRSSLGGWTVLRAEHAEVPVVIGLPEA